MTIPGSGTVALPTGEKVSGAFVCRGIAGTAPNQTATWERLGVSDVSAIVVAIAVIDSRSRRIVKVISNTAVPDLSTAVGALPDFDTTNLTDVATVWRNSLSDTTSNGFSALTTNEIPRLALSGIRIYERYFYLNNP